MNIDTLNPISLALFMALMALAPLVVVMTTSFLKISIVAMLLRNALGVQQIPPNIAIYALALLLTCYVMAPIAQHIYGAVEATPGATASISLFIETVMNASDPLRAFLARHADPEQLNFFLASVKQLWPPESASQIERNDLLVLLPAFMVSELTSAFMIGFLIYLPFVIIDLITQSVMLALGMMMMSPMTVSLPLKLLLFVMADGWSRILHALVLGYQV